MYAPRGWEIERETYADEMLGRLDQLVAASDVVGNLTWLTEKNPEVLQLVLEKIADTGDSKYLPVLERWQNKATRRLSNHICKTRRALKPHAA